MTPKNLFARLYSSVLFSLVALSAQVYASVEVESGLNWIEQQFDGAGYYATSDEIVTPIDSTFEAVVSLDNNLIALEATSLLLLSAPQSNDTISLSKSIIINVRNGADIQVQLNDLLQRQNKDGGFGSTVNSESTVVESSIAVYAALTAGGMESNVLNAALNYLIAMQGADGAWRYSDGIPSVYLTSSVLKTLWLARGLTLQDATTSVYNARQYILSQVVSSTGLWSDVATSATAISAIFPTYPDPLTLTPYLSRLKQLQNSDGSWIGKVFETALAIQALNADSADAIVATLPTALIGKIIDQYSASLIQNFDAILESALNTYTLTGDNGTFAFSDVEGGTYNLVVTAPGYEQSIVSNITVVPNTTRTLADIALSSVPTSAILLGQVFDSVSNQAISGANVSTTGSHTAEVLTDSNGLYQITNIVPGAIQIQINRNGYQVVSAQADAIAGRTLSFNPSLKPNNPPTAEPLTGTPQTSDVAFNVVDVNGDPIKYATIRGTFSGHSEVVMLSSGGLGFASKTFEVEGDIDFSVTKTGYKNINATASIVMGHNFNFNIVMQDEDSVDEGVVDDSHEPQANLPTNSEFGVVVVDRNTGLPIQGALISVVGSTTVSLTSDVTGRVVFDQFETETVTVSVTMNGYLTESGSVELFSGNRSELEVELLQEDAVDARASSLIAQLFSESTNQSVLNANAALVDSDGVSQYVWNATSSNELLMSGLTPGAYNLVVSATGFFDFNRTLVINPGSDIDLGDILLEEQLPAPKLYGVVRDAITLEPLVGAVVASQVSQQSAITDEDGVYALANLSTGEQSIVIDASGYARQSQLIQLDRPVAHKFNIDLSLSTGVGVSIDSSDLSFYEFGAYEVVTEKLVLTNNTPTDKFVHVEFNLFDENNELIVYTRGLDGAGNIVQDSGITVPANDSISSQISWETQNIKVGNYTAGYRLLTATTGVGPNSLVLHEVFEDVEIVRTNNIQDGSILFTGNSLDVGELTLFEPIVELVNGSNVDVNLTTYYQIIDPDGAIVGQSYSDTDDWDVTAQKETIELPPLEVLIRKEGNYLLEVIANINGAQRTIVSDPMLSSPSIRVDVTQSLSDDFVYPNEEKVITVNIQLEGKEYFGE